MQSDSPLMHDQLHAFSFAAAGPIASLAQSSSPQQQQQQPERRLHSSASSAQASDKRSREHSREDDKEREKGRKDEGQGGQQLATRSQEDTEGELQIVTSNAEGKSKLDDVNEDLGACDGLLLQEVQAPFDAEGHVVVTCESEVPEAPVADAALEVEHAETFIDTLSRMNLRGVMPQGSFKPTSWCPDPSKGPRSHANFCLKQCVGPHMWPWS